VSEIAARTGIAPIVDESDADDDSGSFIGDYRIRTPEGSEATLHIEPDGRLAGATVQQKWTEALVEVADLYELARAFSIMESDTRRR
jgi:hypothetical protein